MSCIEGYDNKYLLIGFDMNGNLIEVMYNLVGEVPKSLWLLGLEFVLCTNSSILLYFTQ
ncbi:hypothetical protein AGMMS50268_35280 [Spirochaetia bacterium]|nr:hypothetical protein AGMMS50268_35280 [Spirochaetia bacterium]